MPLLLLACLLLQAAGSDPVIREAELSLEMPLPAGYRIAEGSGFRRSMGSETWAYIGFKYSVNDSPLPQSPAGPRQQDVVPRLTLPKDVKTVFSTSAWGELTVGVVEFRAAVNDVDAVGMAAVIPIQKKSVAVLLIAPVTFEKEMKEDFRKLLAGVKGPTNWLSPREASRAAWARRCEWAAGGLFVLYLACWAIFFRGDVLRAHLLRTVWLAAIGVLLFIPLGLADDFTLTGAFLNLFWPLVFFSFAGRRVKLAIDLG